MSDFLGWKAVDKDGLTHLFSGAKPSMEFISLVKIETEEEFSAEVRASRFAPMSLEKERTRKARFIDNALAAKVAGGFTSSATGAPRRYKSSPADLSQLAADLALAGAGVDLHPVLCSIDGASWSFVSHTSAQIAAVLSDYRAQRLDCHARAEALKAESAAAPSVDAVRAVAHA